MLTQRHVSIFRSWINPFLSLMFVGTFTFAACLLIWHAAFGENPVANMMATAIERSTQLPDSN